MQSISLIKELLRENMRNFRMEEIAKAVGVSPATVSRTLHSPHLVHPKTRQRILQLMEESGYIYNATAGDLSRKKSNVLGILIPIAQHVAFGYTTLAILEKAQEEGFSTILGNTKFDPEMERRLLHQFLERRAAGVILMGFSIGQEKPVVDLIQHGIPCVVIWEILDNPNISYVGFDNRAAARSVVEYLLSLGHRRIGLIISLYSKLGRIKRRLEGYQDALESQGISFDPALVIEREPTLMEGKEAMGRLLALPDPPTAVFCASDYLTIGALAAAKERGLKVPDDVSIAGFDDIEFAAYCDPPLTTVRSPSYEMGQMAVKFLSDIIKNKSQEVRRYQFNPDLIIRKSCAPPKRQGQLNK